MTTSHQPQDRYKAVWLIFFMLGLGTLLPWNFFMTATQYFTNRLDMSQNMSLVTAEVSKDIQASAAPTVPLRKWNSLSAIFNNVMTLCAMLPLLFFTCLNSFLHQRIPQSVRILGSLVAILLVFLTTAILVKVQLDALPFFIITMLKITLINSFGAILQGSLFGLAGLLPASYTAPIMSGQGLAGFFASMAMICAIASGSGLSESAFGYFITACAVIILTIICYLGLPRLEFYRYYQQLKLEGPGEQETKLDLISKDPSTTSRSPEEHPRAGNEESRVSAPNSQPTNKSHSIKTILKNISVLALSVCFIFTITIGLFPAVTVEVKSSIAGNSTWERYFIPVSCFLNFNVFDLLGRILTAVFMWPGKDSRWLPGLVLARLVFLPLLLLCNVQPRQYLPVVFKHDAWFIVFVAAFAFSNGYLASLCMCFGPKKVKPVEAETAGAIMAFFLCLGLALGAVFSFLFRAIV
ncbi:PREDICTED: equilibrative nucleoside transporter 1 isoform X1 [Galeopterus variegatus]|uniref:Equilibrative nucleoside transporter 1 isoform X1 n=1 Tax=Galeopterus variegatus TaxID=482537 RepID=A0ABM0QR64_GALVR|nr:PREDICTED: equilibrative nucleoside transporter 1 isoform X1 [Galeopterus variegatus]XP_008570856.1 PREDICTED: equilibrative nucleoside transporter 1 isoform X1 [Galeopterus variegatus]XP_008570857.1 PREDICTED: equilibrative nucleoside transporter 1 isoform X1 [Galeopterus variegatus]XP_008570858.1 PREDICTED: equilibrative nucleoside transporter 1 isoform X1 [Galeopterus variegatus]XP_008570859.1 PREDICTED: equilibrative nucleoside transporter 1 isoform X1 [Galeopterus variegatus]